MTFPIFTNKEAERSAWQAECLPRFMHFNPLYVVGLVVVILVVFGTLSAFVLAVGGGTRDFPYVASESLLTPAERSFFGVLQHALGLNYHLFAKVRLADIIEVQGGLSGKRRYAALNRINAKHADFVACDPKTFRVIGVIELDDASHRAPKRQQRDQFVDSALAAASIPVLRVTAQRTYSPAVLRQQVETAFYPAVNTSQTSGSSPLPAQ